MSVCTSLFVLASFFFAISVITPTGGRGEEVGEATEVHVHVAQDAGSHAVDVILVLVPTTRHISSTVPINIASK